MGFNKFISQPLFIPKKIDIKLQFMRIIQFHPIQSPLFSFLLLDCKDDIKPKLIMPYYTQKPHRNRRKLKKPNQHFQCSCGRLYANENGLRQHTKWECGKMAAFKCHYCDYLCHRSSTLNRHIKFIHGNCN